MRSAGVMLFLAALVGCSSAPLPFEERPALKKVLSSIASPSPYKVAVLKSGAKKGDASGSLGFSKIALDLLEKTRAFRSVTLLEGENVESVLETARHEGIDIIVTGRTSFGGVTYKGHTGWRVPKVVVWSISEFLSALMADEVYTVEASATLDLYSVHRRSRIESVKASTRTRVVLNDYQRGFKIWGIWRVPSSLHKGNFAKIREAAAASVAEDLKEALGLRLFRTLEPVRLAGLVGASGATPNTQAPAPHVVASAPYEVFLLAVGGDSVATPSAARSASKFVAEAKSLLKGKSYTRVLKGWNARLSAIESAIEEAKARKAKTAVLYLALPASAASDGVKVRLADGYCELDELVRRLRGLEPERVLLFCDVYAETGGWRCSADENTLVVFARKPGEKYLLKGGVTLFCTVFDTVLRLSDSNGDGMVTPAELSDAALRWMRRQSRLLKAYQTPAVMGGAHIPLAGR